MTETYHVRGKFNTAGEASTILKPRQLPLRDTDGTISVVLSRDFSGTVILQKSTNTDGNWATLQSLTYGGVFEATAEAGYVYRLYCSALANGSVSYQLAMFSLTDIMEGNVGGYTGAIARRLAADGIFPRASFSPMAFGAKGDGVYDDTQAVLAAASAGPVDLAPGKTYRIASNCTITSNINNRGGLLSADSGVDVLTGGPIGADNVPCFTGAGSFRPIDNHFSLGWYAGATYNAKWEFMQRAFTTDVLKVLDIPPPLATDPAASLSGISAVWRQTAPIYMNDPENYLTITQRAGVYAAAAMDAMVIYGNLQKPENIIWHDQKLDCGNNATSGELIQGGARILHYGYTDISRAVGAPVRITAEDFPVDEPQWDMLNITNCGVFGFDVDAIEQVLDLDIKELFYNGGKNTCTNVYRLKGKIRNASIHKVLENTQLLAGLFGPSESLGVIETNTSGAPQNVFIGRSRANITAVPTLITRDTTSGVMTDKIRLTVDYQDSPNYSAGATIQLAYVSSANILPQRFDPDATGAILSLTSTVDYVQATNIDLAKITGTINRLKIGNTFYKRRSIADDTASFLELPSLFSGAVQVITEGDSNAYGMSLSRQGAVLLPGFAGSSYNIATGVLSGTTSTDGKLNVSLNGGATAVLYVENRTGTTRNFLMIANGGNVVSA